MKSNKSKRVIAIIALVFMIIATVSITMTLFDPAMFHGSIGYIALVSFLLGVGFFLVIKFMFKEPRRPEYLPDEQDGNANPDGEQEQQPTQTKSGEENVKTESDTSKTENGVQPEGEDGEGGGK